MKNSYLKQALALTVSVLLFTSCENENIEQENNVTDALQEQLDNFIDSNSLDEIKTISFDDKTIALDEITNIVMLEEVENKFATAYYSLFTEDKIYLFSKDQITAAEFDEFIKNENSAVLTQKNASYFVTVKVWNFRNGMGEQRCYKRNHDTRVQVSSHFWNMSSGFSNKASSYHFSQSNTRFKSTVVFYNYFNRSGRLFSKTLNPGKKEVGVNDLFGGYNNTISCVYVKMDTLM